MVRAAFCEPCSSSSGRQGSSSTRIGALCTFGFSCIHGANCRGLHTGQQTEFFAKQQAELQRVSGEGVADQWTWRLSVVAAGLLAFLVPWFLARFLVWFKQLQLRMPGESYRYHDATAAPRRRRHRRKRGGKRKDKRCSRGGTQQRRSEPEELQTDSM